MSHEIDTDKLSALLQEARDERGLGLRKAAKKIGGLSASTLSRIEKGKVPDVDTFVRICRWLDKSPEAFIIDPPGDDTSESGSKELDTVEEIAVHLRADQALSEETTNALMQMIRMAHRADQEDKLREKSET
jgi:transcriptional regulator with XRE-family HTH domain